MKRAREREKTIKEEMDFWKRSEIDIIDIDEDHFEEVDRLFQTIP